MSSKSVLARYSSLTLAQHQRIFRFQVAVHDEAGLSQGVLRFLTNGRQLSAKASTTEKTDTESINHGVVFALNIEDANLRG